ncbi:laccase-11-like [Anneissia japonica]|uniref:laccase-11-like n=1 Tax=Anneissia japonica TaxID=1529436 RepID=UPI00142581B6|nr:laccase-11-like [Anneissia japonica]
MNLAQVTSIILIFTHNGLISTSLECVLKQEISMNNNSTDCFRQCKFPARPRVCEFEFTIKWGYILAAPCVDCPDNKFQCGLAECFSADGSSRAIISINDYSPGPSIHVCHGDIIRVKVNNELQGGNALTIHWHGIHQFETNWADGVPMITQCPIPSATSFVYKFVADPPGTHWWRSHNGVQRGDGLYGALIVRVPTQTEINSKEYDFDLQEHSIIFSDWTSTLALDKFTLLAQNAVPTHSHTLTILANGKGKNKGITIDVPIPVFKVEWGYRYRMRVVNGAIGECNIKLTIESHPITVIATDGFDVEPVRADSLVFAPGERLDFVLEASANPSVYCIFMSTAPYDLCPGNGSAILNYGGVDLINLNCDVEPKTKRLFSTLMFKDEEGVFTLSDTHAHYAVDPDLYFVSEVYYVTLDLDFNIMTGSGANATIDHTTNFMMNHVEFMFPSTPFVSSEASDIDICEPTRNHTFVGECMEKRCTCTNVLKLKVGQVVEFVIIDSFNISDHSMHIHGHSFRVLAQGKMSNLSAYDIINYDKTVGITRISLKSSVEKDTINVPMGGYSIIRWKAENPGYWFFHSQVENYALLGMTMVIQVGDDDEILDPPKDFPSCGPWSPD